MAIFLLNILLDILLDCIGVGFIYGAVLIHSGKKVKGESFGVGEALAVYAMLAVGVILIEYK